MKIYVICCSMLMIAGFGLAWADAKTSPNTQLNVPQTMADPIGQCTQESNDCFHDADSKHEQLYRDCLKHSACAMGAMLPVTKTAASNKTIPQSRTPQCDTKTEEKIKHECATIADKQYQSNVTQCDQRYNDCLRAAKGKIGG